MLALCGEWILCGVHSFVHSGLAGITLCSKWVCAFTVEFAIKFVLNGFDLAVGFRVVFVLNGFSVVVWALSLRSGLCSRGSI